VIIEQIGGPLKQQKLTGLVQGSDSEINQTIKDQYDDMAEIPQRS
jgi:hypothetical protein